jgi:4-amino-4-deoxy-L-arabinose transferase-like glycosyltransferase
LRPPSPYARFAPHAILFVAFLLRIANLTGESLWRDEVDTVRFAFEPLGNILANFTATGFNGPLYHLAVRTWLTLGGVNDFALRYFSLACGVVLVALVYVLGTRMFGRRAGLVAMWLAAIAPILIWYAGEGKMYSLQPMLLTLALYALLRVVGGRGSGVRDPASEDLTPGSWPLTPMWWAVFILATSFSFYVQLLSPLFLGVAVIFFAAMWPQSKRHIVAFLIALALLTLPYAPLAVWQLPTLVQGGNIGHAFYPLDVIALTLASNWTLGLDGRAPLLNLPAPDVLVTLARYAVFALFALLIAYGLAESARQMRANAEERTRFKLQLATLAWLLLPTFLVFVVSTRLPIFQPRYVLWSAPALYLLTGAALARLRADARLGQLASTLALIVLSAVSLSGLISQVINPIRPDLRGASAFIASAAQPGDVIVFQIPYGRHGYAYYAQRLGAQIDPTQIIEAPYTNYGMSEEEVEATLLPAIGAARRVWLYETEPGMWDQRGLVRSWLDGALTPLNRCEFRGVSVGLYEPVR